MQEPLFTEQANVEINAIQGAEYSDGIRTVFQNTSRTNRVWRLIILGKWPRLNVVIQLLVIKAATCQRFLSPSLGEAHAFRSEEHTSELQSLRHLVCRLLLE